MLVSGLESGQALSARFILVRCLGAGGSGVVWLAQDRERNCHVAVKILADGLTQDAAAAAALERECGQVRALEHPNILRVDGLYASERHTWIAMEYASGGDLSQLRGRDCRAILRAAIPIAAALAYAHARRIVHRDLKPANILLSSDGTPRLSDFGMSLTVASEPAPEAGRGSPFSMSPQQAAGAPAHTADDMYAFGAMLYELLSGYPPFYPHAMAVGTEPVSLANLPASVPPAVVQLIERLLAGSPADRPANMQTVEQELKAALAALPAAKEMNEPASSVRVEPPSVRPVAQGEPLRGEWRRPAATATSHDELRRQGFRRGLGAAAVALGIAGVVFVFFALPRWVGGDQGAHKSAAVPVAKPESPAPEQKQDVDFAALARAKQKAEELRGGIAERLNKLTERAADQWGGAEYQQATADLDAGDKAFAARDYDTAVRHFDSIAKVLTTLEKNAGQVLAAQLKRGATALQEGRSADARAAFELAAKIEPANQVAARGLKRAATLDEVLNLVATAEQLEREGKWAEAAGQFGKALALDSEATRAAQGKARVAARLASDTFASAMARGYSALAAADYTSARNAFEEARKIRPNAPEIDTALRQIEQEQRTHVIAAKLKTAQQLETQERWADALKEYRAVVELDSTVAAGNDGVARAAPRTTLNEQLELYLTQPERLFSQPVRAAAREVLARASEIANPGPILKRQIATLGEWLARADVPVAVALQSDNLTQVTIYRVGTLGAFEQRSLDLVPGSYTIVGTRPGYRDVRRQFNVMPGSAPQPLVIRCEDPI
jgi:eukaryotic-like serine/threonine-protein kinase